MVLLSLGSNLGDKRTNLWCAIEHLSCLGSVVAVSDFYSSEPWGFQSDNGFVNCCVALDEVGMLSPSLLLKATQRIEREMGRLHKSIGHNYADRIIDIDILDIDGMIVRTDELSLPHAGMHLRNFVLYPLCDIAAEWIHPVLNLTAEQLRQSSVDEDIPARL